MPPNLTGYYCFVSQKNMEDYLQALSNGLTPPRPFSLPYFPLPSCLSIPLRRGNAGVGLCGKVQELAPVLGPISSQGYF